MNQAEAESAAQRGYDDMAELYTNHVALEMTVPSIVRSALDAFALRVQKHGGLVADVGCGPGHVTAYLAERGLDIFGVDNSPALLEIARASQPDIRFEIGQLASLPVEGGSLQAVVAKHSIIHTPANLVSGVLDEFARVLAPGGRLFLSFFGAESPATHGEGFDHAVTTAYQLDVEIMATSAAAAGLTEELRIVRQPDENERQLPHGTLFLRKQPER